MNKLVLKLDRMASKARRHEYQIGDYWNACDEGVDEILRLERECNEARAILNRAVTWWLKEGMQHFEGAPEWVFEARRVVDSDEA